MHHSLTSIREGQTTSAFIRSIRLEVGLIPFLIRQQYA